VEKPTTKHSLKNAAARTDEEKRLAKNAALREWRQKNKERFAAYMKA
jgi:hypothetical protein